MLLVFIFLRAKPEGAAEDKVQESTMHVSYKEQLKMLLKNRNYFFVALSAGF